MKHCRTSPFRIARSGWVVEIKGTAWTIKDRKGVPPGVIVLVVVAILHNVLIGIFWVWMPACHCVALCSAGRLA
ncbi:MAG: hypothetical protein IPO37_25420 [Saprospiraceae bacterium]|nr:hypothetical protein [Saprospiraceae bacterium]